MYYGINSDLSMCGPFDSAMSASEDVIHLRTAEEWIGLFDAVDHVAAQHPEQPQYYSINGMAVYFLGGHPTKESAQLACDEIDKIVEKNMRLSHEKMTADPEGAGLLLTMDIEEVVAAIPTGRFFTAENVPAWREQLTALIQ